MLFACFAEIENGHAKDIYDIADSIYRTRVPVVRSFLALRGSLHNFQYHRCWKTTRRKMDSGLFQNGSSASSLFLPPTVMKKTYFQTSTMPPRHTKRTIFLPQTGGKNLPCRNNLLLLFSNEEGAFVPVLARLIFSLVPPPRSPPFFRSCCNHHDLA